VLIAFHPKKSILFMIRTTWRQWFLYSSTGSLPQKHHHAKMYRVFPKVCYHNAIY